MNPLDEKLNQAIDDLRDQTGHRMSTTRSYILARMRHERLLKWGIAGGGTALLSLAVYFLMGTSEPPSQPLTDKAQRIEASTELPSVDATSTDMQDDAALNDRRDAQGQSKKSHTLTLGEAELNVQQRKLEFERSRDNFYSESTAIAQKAADAVAADDLVGAAKTFRHLAQFCEKRNEWRRALLAYDSAVAYARQIGDRRLLADLTKEQSTASKNVTQRN